MLIDLCDTTTTPSDGAHLAETPQVVGDPTCDSKTWKYMLGQPAATQRKKPAAAQEGEECTPCGDTHPTVSNAGSGDSCSEKVPEPTAPQRVYILLG